MKAVAVVLIGLLMTGQNGKAQEVTKVTVRTAETRPAKPIPGKPLKAIIVPVSVRPAKPVPPVPSPVVRESRPVSMLVTDTPDAQGRIAVLVGDGRFADLLLTSSTRIERGRDAVPASAIVSGTRLAVYGKWDTDRPTIFRAYSVRLGSRLPEIEVRREIERACANVARRRTVPSAE